MSSLDRDALYRLDAAAKYCENVLSKLNSIKEQLNSDSLLNKLVEGVRMHELYILNFKKFLNNEIDWIPPTHTQCNFGKIYYSIDKSYISKTYGEAAASMFERIGNIHMSFHETAEECLKCKNNQEFKMLIVELASKSSMLVDMALRLSTTLSRN
jgi:methyl-accepting chemotaxis protein